MKKILLILILSGVVTFSFAQSKANKFGFVNAAEVLTAMPGYNDAKSKLDKYAKQLEEQLKGLETEFNQKYQNFLENEKDWPESIKEAKMQQLQSLEQTLQQSRMSFQEDYMKEEQKYLEVLKKELKTAIESVAKKNGYTYIFDSSAGTLLYMPESDNVKELVKKELGIAG